MAKNPFCEAVSWICGANDVGKAAWCHKGGWEHADDFVSEWRFLSEDEIATLLKTSRLLKNFNIDTIGEAKRLRLSEWHEQRGCGSKGWDELQEKLDNYLKDTGESRYG